MSNVVMDAEVRLDTCPVCDSTKLKSLAEVPGRWIGAWLFEPYRYRFGLTRCAECALVFVNPRPSSRVLSAFYKSEHYVCHRLDDPRAMAAKADFVLGRVTHHQAPEGRLLDFGCGSGWLIAAARDRGWDAIGFDVGDRALAECRERGLPVVSSLREVEAATCDAIILHHVLEHVERFDELFRELTRVLKPGGRLFVEVPNAASLRARLALPSLSRHLSADERYRAFPIHLSYFSASNLCRLVESFGFRPRAVETYGLGIDEFFFDRDSERMAYAGGESKARSALPRPLRSAIKHAVYGLGLGENLLVVAEPYRDAPALHRTDWAA